jgi:phage tail P2-like protein
VSNGGLLPPSATAQERALDLATARVGEVPVRVRDVWNPDTCPAHMLPWLAWAFSVDEWDATWTEAVKREVIRSAIQVQRKKGTVWAIKRAISSAGYGDSALVERVSDHWAKYSFTLTRPISNAQSAQVRRILEAVAPARCWIHQLNFTQANNLHNNVIRYDGAYNHGTA